MKTTKTEIKESNEKLIEEIESLKKEVKMLRIALELTEKKAHNYLTILVDEGVIDEKVAAFVENSGL